jgi:hypothetical protein
VCGDASPYNDANMCKQFIDRSDVLCGSARKVLAEHYEKLEKGNLRLESELKFCETEKRDLEDEVKLLRIIKQTLEMQSGMKFEF